MSNEKAIQQEGMYHVPVMLEEALEGLNIDPNGVYVDCTFGGGGHSKAILAKLGPGGRLLAFDQDEDARRNIPADERIIFIPENFRHLQRFLKFHKHPRVDGILADLGVSSHQFDEPDRGFSIRHDAPMDMRMDKRRALTAAEILETYGQVRLHKLFEQYGEVTNARTLAAVIEKEKGSGKLKTISGFREIVAPVVKGNPNKYLAKVFQALRIEVNDEMGALKELLQQIPDCLKPGGRAVIITFHSLEDRIVKNFFRDGIIDESPEDSLFGGSREKPLKPVNRKPVTPGDEELAKNSRSRSAKLRIAEKTNNE